MSSTDNPLPNLCSSPRRDRRNQGRYLLWCFAWAVSFIAVTLGIKKEWLSFGFTFAGVGATALLGAATVLAYRRYLQETDELRRKIEVEALAAAFGIGVFGGLTYWLLVVGGYAPARDFAYVFCGMVIIYSLGVLIGRRRYA